ncbi:MAG: tetratricopeptide repeat protein, partial [Saprospiraceae bacterium]
MAKGYRPSKDKSEVRNVNPQNAGDETIIDLGKVKAETESYFHKNQTMILSVLGGLVLLGGAFFAYKYLYKEPKQNEALEQMYQAELMFQKDSLDAALNNPGGGHAGFKEIAENYAGTPAGNLAKYYAGLCNLYLGNYKDAKDYFTGFNAEGEVMTILKNGGVGDASADLNELDAAVAFYEKASNSDNEFLTPVYLKKLAVLKEKMGDKAAAIAAYTKIKEKYPNAPDANNIERFIIANQ